MNRQEKETYRNIWGYNGKYQVSNLGNVRNAETMQVLKPDPDRRGYLRVKLVSDKERNEKGRKIIKHWFIHRLVGLCFVPIYSFDFSQINHEDGCKWNNNATNLTWCDGSINQTHRYKLAKHQKNEGIGLFKSKLTYDQILDIKKRYAEGDITQKALAQEFNVSQAAICQIVSPKRPSRKRIVYVVQAEQ